MIWIIFLLCAIAAVAKAAMDTLNFWYHESLFEKWAGRPTGWGEFWRTWSGPRSWENKYLMSGHPIMSWLLQGPLVFLTDAWHFFQFVYLTVFQLSIGLLAPSPWWLWLIGLKVGMGLVFELSTRTWRDEIEVLQGRQKLRAITMDEVRTAGPSIRWAQLYLVGIFFLAIGVSSWLGGDPEAAINAGAVGAIIVAALGLLGYQILRTKVFR